MHPDVYTVLTDEQLNSTGPHNHARNASLLSLASPLFIARTKHSVQMLSAGISIGFYYGNQAYAYNCPLCDLGSLVSR